MAMHRFIDGEDRMQQALLPHSLEDYVGEENPVRVVEVFIDELDLAALGIRYRLCLGHRHQRLRRAARSEKSLHWQVARMRANLFDRKSRRQ